MLPQDWAAKAVREAKRAGARYIDEGLTGAVIASVIREAVAEDREGRKSEKAANDHPHLMHFSAGMMRNRMNWLDMMAAAFIQETGLPASECELVEKRDGNNITWFFRRKADATVNARGPSPWLGKDEVRDITNRTQGGEPISFRTLLAEALVKPFEDAMAKPEPTDDPQPLIAKAE